MDKAISNVIIALIVLAGIMFAGTMFSTQQTNKSINTLTSATVILGEGLDSIQKDSGDISDKLDRLLSDTGAIKQTQESQGQMLQDHGARLDRLEASVNTQAAMSGGSSSDVELKDLLKQLIQQKNGTAP